MNLPLAIIAHLIGDFLLQNHWMQTKIQNTRVCMIHVCAYMIPFACLMLMGLLPAWVFAFIMVQHFLQDRFMLHIKWMRLYRQTTPAQWPGGPLFVDQSWHLAFIGIFYIFTL